MAIIFKLMIVLGVLECCVGIASTFTGQSIIASIRQPPSMYAGVPELVTGIGLIAMGTVAVRALNKR
jgi:hypothetical protein